MKKKTIERNKEIKKRIADIFCQSLLYISIAAILVVLFALADLGLLWDELKNGSNSTWAHVSLILFRVLLYGLPAFIGYLIWKRKNKPQNRNAKLTLLIDCYNIQFFIFSLILAIYELLALDYRLNLDILDKMDSFIFIAGFIVSIFIKKEIPEDEIEQLDVSYDKKDKEVK